MKRKKAYEIAIEAITMRQRYWWTGHLEYLAHGDRFLFAVRDHNNWQKLENAKIVLEKELEEMEAQQLELIKTKEVINA